MFESSTAILFFFSSFYTVKTVIKNSRSGTRMSDKTVVATPFVFVVYKDTSPAQIKIINKDDL